jgi:predicted  nucleic acid-binding Zn-ribbon protein
MKKVVLFCLVVFALIYSSSCVKNSSEYKQLQAQRDSLALASAKSTSEMDEMLSLLNEVEDNFKSIKSAENYLSVQSNNPGELAPTTKEKIHSDMKFVTETLEKNRQKIAELEKKLKGSSLQSTQLQQTITNLRVELDQKTMSLVALNEELERKTQQITELSTNVSNLSKDVQELRVQSSSQQQTITQQGKVITTVYYCFGTSNELKNQKILVNDQLGANFNRNYFIKVNDFNKLQTIPLMAKKGKLVSKHPDGSYEFIKDANNQVELRILDPANFWSLTKYLVILVNV